MLTRRHFLAALALLTPTAALARKRGDHLDRKPPDVADSIRPKLVKTIRIVGEPPPYAGAGVAQTQVRYRSPTDIYDAVPPFNGRK